MSNRWMKLIRSLQQKKYRRAEGLFLVEGEKNVIELLNSSLELVRIFATKNFLESHAPIASQWAGLWEETNEASLEKAGTFKTNSKVLAIARIRPEEAGRQVGKERVLALENVRDPGNLGTIVRIADWYGLQKIFCTETCADFYNPKTIAASMGSFTRVHTHYCHLPSFLESLPAEVAVVGTFMEGDSLHTAKVAQPSVVLMGNESHGLSSEVAKFAQQRLTIPRYGKAESLNVAIATAVVLDHLCRQG